MKKTRQRLILDYPFFGTLSLSMGIKEDRSVQVCATDGKDLFYNPEHMETRPAKEKLFIFLHEIGHIILMHPFRREDRNFFLWNLAGDYAVNAMLATTTNIPLPEDAQYDLKFDGMSTEQIYDILNSEAQNDMQAITDALEQDQGQDQASDQSDDDSIAMSVTLDFTDDDDNQGQNQDQDQDQYGSFGSDQDGDSDQDSNQDGASDSDQDTDDAQDTSSNSKSSNLSPSQKKILEDIKKTMKHGLVKDAPEDFKPHELETTISSAVTANDMVKENRIDKNSGLFREIEKMFSKSVDWISVLHRFVNEACKKDYNWLEPNMRYSRATNGLIMPSNKSDQSLKLAVVFDTSMSIDYEKCSRFFAEFQSMLETIEFSELHVLSCSDMIFNPQVFYQGQPIDYKPTGDGYTESWPVWEYLRSIEVIPACLIYFTDLQVFVWGDNPGYPILWVADCGDRKTYEHYKSQVPFGETVLMEEK